MLMMGREIKELEKFESTSLKEIDEMMLLNRIDTKFVVSESVMFEILDKLSNQYKILYVNELNCLPYSTQYYDTEAFDMYYHHVNGKLNRYKIRVRSYSATNNSVFETKFKNNLGRCIKQRVSIIEGEQLLLGLKQKDLLNQTPYGRRVLGTKLYNNFNRVLLLNKADKERITVDFNICFSKDRREWIGLNNAAVVEVKQDTIDRNTPIFRIMKEKGIRSDGFSKYCIGSALLYPGLKRNILKPKLKHLKNIVNCNILD
jgi:hypothetical protein